MEVDIRPCSSDGAMQENLASLLATRIQGSVFIGFLAEELSSKTTVFWLWLCNADGRSMCCFAEGKSSATIDDIHLGNRGKSCFSMCCLHIYWSLCILLGPNVTKFSVVFTDLMEHSGKEVRCTCFFIHVRSRNAALKGHLHACILCRWRTISEMLVAGHIEKSDPCSIPGTHSASWFQSAASDHQCQHFVCGFQ